MVGHPSPPPIFVAFFLQWRRFFSLQFHRFSPFLFHRERISYLLSCRSRVCFVLFSPHSARSILGALLTFLFFFFFSRIFFPFETISIIDLLLPLASKLSLLAATIFLFLSHVIAPRQFVPRKSPTYSPKFPDGPALLSTSKEDIRCRNESSNSPPYDKKTFFRPFSPFLPYFRTLRSVRFDRLALFAFDMETPHLSSFLFLFVSLFPVSSTSGSLPTPYHILRVHALRVKKEFFLSSDRRPSSLSFF